MLSRNFCQKCVRVNFWSYHTTVWKNEKFSLTEKIFRQINSLVISLVETLLSRNFCQKCVRLNRSNFHTVNTAQCGNYGNLLSHFFGKNSVKATLLLKKVLNWWFDEKKKSVRVQGVSFEIFWFQMVAERKLCIFDPKLVKPKCIWGVAVFFKNQL